MSDVIEMLQKMSSHMDSANAAAALVALNALRYFNLEHFQQHHQQVTSNVQTSPKSTSPSSTHTQQTQSSSTNTATSTLPTISTASSFFTHENLSLLYNPATLAQYQQQLAAQMRLNLAAMASVAQLEQSQQPNDDAKCHACGDKSTGSHFGGISCESCKAFFRRSVQRNRWEDYKCSYTGECKMNTSTRKICQYCRYQRCLAIGMRPKWVLSDDERQQKYGSRRKKQQMLAELAAKTAITTVKVDKSTSTNEQNEDEIKMEVDETRDTKELEEIFYKNGANNINMFSKLLDEYDQIVIDKLSYAFYCSRNSHNLDLSSVEADLKSLQNEHNNQETKRISKVVLANFMVQPVKRVISFAKLIPDFRKLTIEDQMALLRGSTMEIFICSSQNLFDKSTNSFTSLVSRDRNILSAQTSNIQLDILRYIWSEDVLNETVRYLKTMNDLNIDETTLILYLALILFSPDRHDLTNRALILQIQSQYSYLLYKYLLYKYKSIEIANDLYNKLLIKLMDLRNLQEIHSSILLDAETNELDMYSKAIIGNTKDENLKFKNVQNLCSINRLKTNIMQ